MYLAKKNPSLLMAAINHGGTFRGMVQEHSIIYYYLSEECYRNGTRAYLKLHPTAKYQSAKASASRLLKKPSVKQAMKHKLDKMKGVEGC